jgi:hypothetical protein
MPPDIDQREAIAAALADFGPDALPVAACRMFAVLGYKSDRRLHIDTVPAFCKSFDPNATLTAREREQLDRLTSLHFLFQLTDAELTLQRDLLDDSTAVESTRIHSYLFFAAELPAGSYTRTFLSGIARAINKPLPMPALVLFRHGDSISLAILHRRLNKREAERDVLEKATLIKDIRCGAKDEPIRAHLEILNDFVLANLDADFGIHNFVSLHNAWQKRLATFALNDRFYYEVANWYFWAKKLIASGEIVPPRHVDTDPERSLFLIRLLTRLIFCWFLLEKRLLPSSLFREKELRKLLSDFDPASPSFYRAVLQNLFFGTLNQPADERGFRKRSSGAGRDSNRGITNLWRYAASFREPAQWEELAKTVPFLNGGLFDCLDRVYEKADGADNTRLDGFSDNPKEAASLPNYLFFDDTGRTVDLSAELDDEKKPSARSRKTPVRGLIQVLSRYKFTIEENTPLDEEIALDPELLGKVFENLLASYNPETRDTARKALGAFYTPREVVSFMVDEALIAYLEPHLGGSEATSRLRGLFEAQVDHFDNPFSDEETDRLVTALDDVKILDPACGSGAFPMGALQRLVNLLAKLDPRNERWERHQRARLADDRAAAEKLADAGERAERLADLDRWDADLRVIFDTDRFQPDYARKVFLIENAIFGADIQPVAVQIAKLRFFIALICDQKTDGAKENKGVLPLPNLETRIVAANTLLPAGSSAAGRLGQADLLDQRVDRLRAALREVHHEHFQARTLARKRRCRERDARLRAELAEVLRGSGLPAKSAAALAGTDLFDQNSSSPFFEPGWMFSHPSPRRGHSALEGFDLVVGNPPYVRQEKIKDQKDELKPHYPETFTGTADLYVYFYDRALQLLRPGGILSYITSNKWYRAAYGEKLRAHLGKATTLLHAIDFGDAPVFTAIAYPTIVIARKAAPPAKHTFRALNWDPETPNTEIANFAKFYEAKSSRAAQSSLLLEGWRFLPKKHQDLLEKIRGAGVPLGKFAGSRLYRGILTGLNDAFVVDQDTRDRLVARDAKTKDLLKPYLRGRDIKRWRVEYENLWLILIESSENKKHPWSGKPAPQAERIFGETYPSIAAHFAPIRDKLIERYDQGHFFWELRSCGYYGEFNELKVIMPTIEKDVAFATAGAGFFSNDKTNFVVHDQPAYLASLLNSRIHWWFAQLCYPTKQGGFVEFKPTFVREFPIVPPESGRAAHIRALAETIIFLAAQTQPPHPRDPLMRGYYEELLNGLVYELYLPEELHAAGLRMFERVAAAGLPALEASAARPAARDAALLITLREKFEELYAPTHPLRASLQKLHTLESIRIIEGKS